MLHGYGWDNIISQVLVPLPPSAPPSGSIWAGLSVGRCFPAPPFPRPLPAKVHHFPATGRPLGVRFLFLKSVYRNRQKCLTKVDYRDRLFLSIAIVTQRRHSYVNQTI